MQNNLLIKTIAVLPRKKVTRFKEFTQSPYFNKHRDVANLIEYLSDTYPNFSERKCNRETISQILFPAKPHNQQKLAIVFTYSMRLLEEFLRVEEAIEGGMLQNDTLLTAQLREHDILFLLEKFLKENVGGAKEKSRMNPSFSTPTFSELQHLSEQDATAVRLANFNHQFLEIKQPMFDAYYLCEKLKDACELHQRSKLLNRKFSPTPLFATALEWANKTAITALPYPSIRHFYELFQLLQSNDTTLYRPLLANILKDESQLSQEELRAIFSHLQNFCIGQINAGKKEFLSELFRIYQSQMDRELLMINGYLPEWHYKNIVTTALRLQEFEWAKNFIESNKTKLQPDVQDNAYRYNMATYHSHLGHFGEVLKLLLQVEYTDLRYNLDAKSLLLRTYYDMEADEALISLTDAFRQYLKRNQDMTEFQKTGYYNLLKLTRSAFRLKTGKGYMSSVKWQASFNKLKEHLSHEKTVFNKTWLQEKMEEMEADV